MAGTGAGKPLRIAILISGRGSNMLQLARHIDRHDLACEIVLVAANQDCVGLAEAAKRNLPTACVDRAAFDDRAAQETALGDHIEAAGADWICLAGYMAVLSVAFVTRTFTTRKISLNSGTHTQTDTLTEHPVFDPPPNVRWLRVIIICLGRMFCFNFAKHCNFHSTSDP